MPERIGSYRIDELLGSGGMGEVYRAYDEKLDRSVAIKLIRASQVRRDTLRRFLREARTAARLSHPAIVQIYHVEEVEGEECIVMELVEGRALSQLVAEGPLEPEQCVALARQIAAGLAEAHAKNVVHRDLKSENVMVAADGRAKILDFGLAKPLLASSSDSRSDELTGTPRSMSPEQANEQPIDGRSDLFSFGTLLYEIATGQSPFRGRTPIVVLHQVCHHRPPAARALNPDVPAELSALIGWLMEKRPEDRPQSAREVLAALETMPGATRRPAAMGWTRPPLLHDERRQVTLLGCSLIRDDAAPGEPPPSLSVVAPGFLNAASEIVQHQLGSIPEIAQGGLVACFGFPRAQEDDARRAVAAALEITEMFRTTLAARDPILRLHVGLHTGMTEIARPLPKLADSAGSGPPRRTPGWRGGELWEGTSELQRRAPPDAVWVSAATHRLIRGFFHCEGPLRIAGADRPVFQVRGPVERRGAAPRGGLRDLVARREELELLDDRWKLAQEGRGQVVVVSGDAGIGKTRLLAALAERLDLGPGQWWACRSLPPVQASSLRPAIALLWQMLPTARAAPPEEHRAKLKELLHRYGLAGHLPYLEALLELSPVAPAALPDRRRRTLEAFVELLLAAAAEKPRVWVVEDLQWTDPSTLDLLDLLVEQVPAARLLLLLSFRPGFRPRWGARTYVTPLVLSALNSEQARALVRLRAAVRDLPEELVRQIVELTDGVPLFVEELTRLVLESGTVDLKDGGLANIPTTLREALTARLDRLGPTKQIAQLAAVFGRDVSHEVLRAVSPFDDETLSRGLRRLIDAELLYRHGVTRVRYVFKHALIRQAAYEALTERERRDYHAQIAAVLETELTDTVRLHPEVLAHHFTAAGQTEKALIFWLQAGRQARASVEAAQHLRRGLRLLGELPESTRRHRMELRFQSALGPVLMATKGFGAPEVKHTYDRMLELTAALGESPDFAALWGYWRFYATAAEWERALDLAYRLEGAAEASGDPTQLMVAQRSVGGVLFHLGKLEAARQRLERGLQVDCGDDAASSFPFVHHPRVACQSYAAWVLWHLGRPDRALAVARESLALARRLAEPYNLTLALATVALVHRLRREDDLVLELAAEQMALARRHQFDLLLASARLLHGAAAAARGRSEDGLAEMHEGLAAWRASHAGSSLTFFLGELAQAYLGARRAGDGLEVIGEALKIVDGGGESFYHAELLRLRGELELLRDEEREAGVCFARAAGVAAQQGALSLALRTALSRTKLDDDDAGARVAELYERFTEGFETADLRAAAAWLAA